MQEVSLQNRQFRLLISEAEIKARIVELAAQIRLDYPDEPPVLLGILNGAFLFAADLMRLLPPDCSLSFMRVSTYGDEMKSSHHAKVPIGLQENIAHRHVLIVEDIVDTGFTGDFLREWLAERNPASLRMVTLLYKPDAFKGKIEPEYVGFPIEPTFVIGYGMDFDGQCRNLQDIYQLKED